VVARMMHAACVIQGAGEGYSCGARCGWLGRQLGQDSFRRSGTASVVTGWDTLRVRLWRFWKWIVRFCE